MKIGLLAFLGVHSYPTTYLPSFSHTRGETAAELVYVDLPVAGGRGNYTDACLVKYQLCRF